MRLRLLAAFIASALLCVGAAQKPANPPPGQQPVVSSENPVATSAEARREAFEIVWRTVKEKHFDPTLGGVDWDKVHEMYAPQVAALTDDASLYPLLQRMLGELHQSHFNIIPPEAVVQEETQEPQTGSIGLDVQMISDQAVIARVKADAPAAKAGLHAGFVITSVDGAAVTQLLSRFSKSVESPSIIRLRMARLILSKLNGPPATSVRVSYLDGKDTAGKCSVERVKRTGEMSPPFGNFPSQYMEFETKRLDRGVGYIRFNIFVMPLMEKIRAAIRSMVDASGIIIDLRGNPGGIGGMSSGIAGLLETKQTSLGTMRLRAGYQNFAVFPQPNPYQGPVIILLDGGSASTSEVFASGMQEIGRALVVGERSAGAALPSVFSKLPTGALFQYAIADFRTPKGVLIEGRGVIPDVEVKLDRRALLAGDDPQLGAAIREIEKHAGASRRSFLRRAEISRDFQARATMTR